MHKNNGFPGYSSILTFYFHVSMYWQKFIVFYVFQLVPGRYVVELGYTVIPRLTSDPANEFFG